jgi:hypothetical protein
VLQAELVARYREQTERAAPLTSAAVEQVRLVREATLHEMTGLKADLATRSSELLAATASLAEQGELTKCVLLLIFVGNLLRNYCRVVEPD